jgi:hypothetical protein
VRRIALSLAGTTEAAHFDRVASALTGPDLSDVLETAWRRAVPKARAKRRPRQ